MNSDYANKENDFATQARSFGNDQQQHHSHLEPFRSNQHGAATTQPRLPKKLRPAKNNRKKNDATASNDRPPVNDRAAERPSKVPVDPPGAVLGAMRWMPPNEAFHGPNNNMYQGNNGPFPSMTSWAFQPMPNVGHIHGWSMPPFLAPLAASVRHPFANFVAHHNAHQYYQPQPVANDCEPMEAEESFNPTNDAALKDDSDAKMAELDPVELPSTFAPDDVVEKIRSRNLIENLAGMKSPPKAKADPTQNRVLTRSAAKALKKNSTQAPVVAHQAMSPVVSRESPARCDDEPEIMTVLGKRVTMIDPVRKVFIIDLLSPEQCDKIRKMADDHTRHVHESGSNAQVWREFLLGGFDLCLQVSLSQPSCPLNINRHALHLHKNGPTSLRNTKNEREIH